MRWHVLRRTTGDRKGFTIIEVMIVLAVTGLMFVSVALAISHKQQSTQFQTSLTEARSEIRQVANQVVSGYFPGAGTFDCDTTVATATTPSTIPPTGPSGHCVFIGKVLHFYSSGSDANHFTVYSVLGRDSGNTYDTKIPKVINDDPPAPSPTEIPLGFGLTVQKIKYTALGGLVSYPGSFAFMQSLNASGADAANASQYLTILKFDSLSTLSTNQDNEADIDTNSFRANSFTEGGKLEICFKSGTTNQYGVVTVSSTTSNLDISSKPVTSCP